MQIEGWARDGLTNEQLAANMGVTVKTFYEWQARFDQFREAVKRGKAPVDIQVENALLKKALGYDYEETTTEVIEQPDGTKRKHIKKTIKHVIPDTLAQIYWLKNRRPDKWRDKPTPDMGAGDDPLMEMIKRWDDASAGK